MTPATGVDLTLITPDEVMRRARAAIAAARAFFGVSDEWRIDLIPERPVEDGAIASIELNHAYLTATIRIDVRHCTLVPGEIWGTMGHEVGHVVTAELRHAIELAKEHGKVSREVDDLFEVGIERATVRLERLFERHNPDPEQARAGAESPLPGVAAGGTA